MHELSFLYICLAAGLAAVWEAVREAPLAEETAYGLVIIDES